MTGRRPRASVIATTLERNRPGGVPPDGAGNTTLSVAGSPRVRNLPAAEAGSAAATMTPRPAVPMGGEADLLQRLRQAADRRNSAAGESRHPAGQGPQAAVWDRGWRPARRQPRRWRCSGYHRRRLSPSTPPAEMRAWTRAEMRRRRAAQAARGISLGRSCSLPSGSGSPCSAPEEPSSWSCCSSPKHEQGETLRRGKLHGM